MGIKLRHRIGRWLLRDMGDNAYQTYPAEAAKSTAYSGGNRASIDIVQDRDGLTANNLHLRIYPGLGGIAIETSYYDRKSDNSNTTLHIIPDSEELSDALAKIITLDAMRCR